MRWGPRRSWVPQARAFSGSRPTAPGGGAGAAFGDFDGDGNMELFAGSAWNGDLYFYAGAPGSSAVPASGWSSPRGNSARTGSHRFDPTDRGGVADTSRQLLLSRTAI